MKHLNKLVEKIKKHKVTLIIIMLIAIFITFIIPFIIHIAFSYESTSKFFEAKWSAGDFLGFYAATLATCGTIIVSVVAIKQTNKYIREERKLQNEKERWHIDGLKPRLVCEYVRPENPSRIVVISHPISKGLLRIRINNESATNILNARVSEASFFQEQEKPIELVTKGLSSQIEDKIVITTDEFQYNNHKTGVLLLKLLYCDYEHNQYQYWIQAEYQPDMPGDWKVSRSEVVPQFRIVD
jgi:hypothetical protein